MNSRRFLLRHLALALILSSVALAQGVLPSRTVVRPVLTMYSSATTDADVVSQALYGATVTVLQEKEGWAQIQTPDQYKGWIETAGLLAYKPGEAYASGKNVVQVRSLFAHIYREQDVTKHAPLLTVPFETRLEVAALPDPSKPGRWLTVLLPDGRKGMLQAADVQLVPAPLSIDDTIALSRKFMGLPYTWGGTSSYGYDCSGFTQMLVRQRGKVMPRDADIQAAWSGLSSVERAQLQPGDLLYFGSSPQKITHTGMYIGDGKFINATTHETPMVRIDNLNEPYWTKLLVAARRLKP
jgi:gamma-D-glutamyl-L-lysine dipeptidyl-peptidase